MENIKVFRSLEDRYGILKLSASPEPDDVLENIQKLASYKRDDGMSGLVKHYLKCIFHSTASIKINKLG